MLRLVRLALAIILIADGFNSQTWWLLVPGFFFLYQAVINAGCSSCPVPANNASSAEVLDVEYEEVK